MAALSQVLKKISLLYVVYNNYRLRAELYSFDYGCMIMDGSHLCEPQKRHDSLVPLHHCSIDIGGNRMDLDRLIDWAMDEIPQQYSGYGEPI